MPQMKRAEDYRLATTTGHVVLFKADTPVNVPSEVVPQAKAIGAVLVDKQEDVPVVKQEPTKKESLEEAPVGEDREEKILKVFGEIITRNDSSHFTPGNKPKATVVSQMAGFKVDIKEIAKLWNEYAEKLKAA